MKTDGKKKATEPKRVAIVGAGLRGLASAAYLSSAGVQVRVFEKQPRIGGVWGRVHEQAQINTPSYGYTFHSTNRWNSVRPSRNDILENFERMIESEGLAGSIALSSPVEKVSKTPEGTWKVNDGPEEYDGLLVCSGYLGDPIPPPDSLVSEFGGTLLSAYDVEKSHLYNRHVVVVGSGRSALDMLALAHGSNCRHATLFAYPDVQLRGIGKLGILSNTIYSNPLLYGLTKKLRGDKPEASRYGIEKVLESSRVAVIRDSISRISRHHVYLAQNTRVEADTIIWCTGWGSPTPSWVAARPNDATMVLAACKRCLDNAGFGYGTATVHAKALLATLEYGLTERFTSGTSYCNCDQEHDRATRHIFLNLVLYFLAQPSRWKLLGNGLRQGFRSNMERMRSLDEPTWISLLAFLNAPFGF